MAQGEIPEHLLLDVGIQIFDPGLPEEDEDARVELLVDLGDLCTEKLKQPQEAVSFYDKALVLQPDNRTVMHKLLDVRIGQKRWDEAVSVLKRMQAAEEDPQMKA